MDGGKGHYHRETEGREVSSETRAADMAIEAGRRKKTAGHTLYGR